MIYTYKEARRKCGSDFKMRKAIKKQKLLVIGKGLYSDSTSILEFEYIVRKYRKAIFTMDSAFYFHHLVSTPPLKYSLATTRTALRIKEECVTQVFVSDNLFKIGVCRMKVNNELVQVYDKERMLIELIRNKNRMNPEYYKEVLEGYKRIVSTLNFKKVQKYVSEFRTRRFLWEKIQEELELEESNLHESV